VRIDDFMKLYVHELKDLYSAEGQVCNELPRMIEAANDSGLRDALSAHLDQTKEHITRLEKVFEGMEYEPGGHRCKGTAGVIAEAHELVGEIEDEHVRDAAIIAGCQRIEHYEMAGYGVARAMARRLGRDKDVELLTLTLEEEGSADRKLTELAERHINFIAQVN